MTGPAAVTGPARATRLAGLAAVMTGPAGVRPAAAVRLLLLANHELGR